MNLVRRSFFVVLMTLFVGVGSGFAQGRIQLVQGKRAIQDKVTFIVSGSYASVTYGPAGSNYTGSVPMDVTETIPGQPPIYYAIDAQLQGGGTVSCKIEVNGQTISQGTAQGGYNIATCEISQDPLSGGWTDTNSS